jgi:hypothetical protein
MDKGDNEDKKDTIDNVDNEDIIDNVDKKDRELVYFIVDRGRNKAYSKCKWRFGG